MPARSPGVRSISEVSGPRSPWSRCCLSCRTPRRDRGFFAETPSGAHDPLSRFERWARHPTQVVLLLFGIVAAGVPLRALDWGTLGLPLATLIGKPIGLLIGAGIARACGLSLPARIGWRELVVLGLVAASGFTVALFFAAAAVGPGPTLSALKMGALVSAGAALAAAAAAVLLGSDDSPAAARATRPEAGRFAGASGQREIQQRRILDQPRCTRLSSIQPMLIHELTGDQCREVLGRAELGRLACSRFDQPYVVPIHFSFDADNGLHLRLLHGRSEGPVDAGEPEGLPRSRGDRRQGLMDDGGGVREI